MNHEYSEVERDRLAKLNKLRTAGIDPYPARTRFGTLRVTAAEAARRLVAWQAALPEQTPDERAAALHAGEPTICALMGRIVAKRIMGKAGFVSVEDDSGRLQVYARIGPDSIDAASFELFKDLDLGDFIEAKGNLFITKTGEPTLRATDWSLLSKSISPLPIAKEEKQPDGSVKRYSAFSDPESRYRQRYADLAVNPEVREIFRTRARIIRTLREFFDSRGFLEVETPILQPIYGGAAARPFITHHNQLDQDLYLRISFELYLKRLLVGGFERVYEIGRDFRNEGVSFKHNPEFTQLEFYAAYMDVFSVMDLAEEMMQYVAREVLAASDGKTRFRGHEIDLVRPWQRITLRDAILEFTGIDYTQYPDRESLAAAILAHKLMPADVVQGKTRGKLIDGLLGDHVEKNLVQPTFIYDYPRDISPLAKSKVGDPSTVERFEGFVGGMELCNAFSELNDPLDQEQRFLEEMRGEDEEAQPPDEDYLRAMRYGMPPNGGFGMGIDRLTMLFTNNDSIREVLLFPHLRKEE
ncbi:MAG: lysine--tRNA ligase [Anaerolineae bacterium]|nr:lysine--tRNA ligase [Thermoflexales bacterium]MDW8408444.1 lysine--tRNA ligase [Anaerolineae bacterium]